MSDVAQILREGRQRLGWSQAELAKRAQLSTSTVARTEQLGGLPNVNSVRRLAEAIGYDADALVRLSRGGSPADAPAWGAANSIPGLIAEKLGHWVRVPHFGAVSAVRAEAREQLDGDFSDVPDSGVDFTISVDGQCMEPRYQDGERVGCSLRRWRREGFLPDRDYWIRFTNGEMTIKRFKPDPHDPEKFTCVPLNPKMRPFSRVVADVEKAARVVVVLAV